MGDHGGDGNRPVLVDVVDERLEFRKGALRHRFDEDVDGSPARQPDGEGIIVTDPVTLQHGYARLGDLGG